MGVSNLNDEYAEQAVSKHLSKRGSERSRTFGSLRYLPQRKKISSQVRVGAPPARQAGRQRVGSRAIVGEREEEGPDSTRSSWHASAM